MISVRPCTLASLRLPAQSVPASSPFPSLLSSHMDMDILACHPTTMKLLGATGNAAHYLGERRTPFSETRVRIPRSLGERQRAVSYYVPGIRICASFHLTIVGLTVELTGCQRAARPVVGRPVQRRVRPHSLHVPLSLHKKCESLEERPDSIGVGVPKASCQDPSGQELN